MTIGLMFESVFAGASAPISEGAAALSPVLMWTTAVVWVAVACALLLVAAMVGRLPGRGDSGTVPGRPGSAACCLRLVPCCTRAGGGN